MLEKSCCDERTYHLVVGKRRDKNANRVNVGNIDSEWATVILYFEAGSSRAATIYVFTMEKYQWNCRDLSLFIRLV